MKPYMYLLCLISVLFTSCESFEDKTLLSFRKVYVNNVAKLVKVNVSYNSSDEGSDYWNNYYVTVVDSKTGRLDKKIKFSVDGRNDKGQVLEISAKYVSILADQYILIDLENEKVYKGSDFENVIEDNNAFIRNNIGAVNSFSQNFISVTSKQGDSYVLSLKTFKLYPGNPAKYWEIPDSLQFYHIERSNIRMASNRIDSYVYIAENEKGYSMVYDAKSPSKTYIYEYDTEKVKYQSSKESEFVSITILDTVSFSYHADFDNKRQLTDKAYIGGHIDHLHGDNLYFTHRNEISDQSKELFSCFEISGKREKYTIELPVFKNRRADLYPHIYWSADSKTFFYCILKTTFPIYEFDAANGKLVTLYENNAAAFKK